MATRPPIPHPGDETARRIAATVPGLSADARDALIREIRRALTATWLQRGMADLSVIIASAKAQGGVVPGQSLADYADTGVPAVVKSLFDYHSGEIARVVE